MNTQPTLETNRLILRPFCQSDAKRVQRLAGDHRIADVTLNIPHPYLDGMAEAWIATHASAWNDRSALIYAMAQKSAPDSIIGAISLMELTTREGELGYWAGVPYWNNGFCSEAAKAIIHFGFHTLSLQRIHCCHLIRNPASGRVMQKAGMQKADNGSADIIKHGQRESVTHYEILNQG